MIENKFLHFLTYSGFKQQLDEGNIHSNSIAFIDDKSLIWTHGKEYGGSSKTSYGTSDQRPSGVKTGYVYFDTTLNMPVYWNGSKWIEIYSKDLLDNLITTPEQQYVSNTATQLSSSITDILPEFGTSDTIYRVGCWDGTQYDASVYAEYAWDGEQYKLLDIKSVGIDEVPTQYSYNTVESGGVYDGLQLTLQQIVDAKEKNLITPISTTDNYFVKKTNSGVAPLVGLTSGMAIRKYDVVGNGVYTFSSRMSSGFNIKILTWVDENGLVITQEYKPNSTGTTQWTDVAVVAPKNATEMWMNIRNSTLALQNLSDFKEVANEITGTVDLEVNVRQNTADIKVIQEHVTRLVKTLLTPTSIESGAFVSSTDIGLPPRITENSNEDIRKYSVEGGKRYIFSAMLTKNTNIYVLTWIDTNGRVVSQEYRGSSTEAKQWTDEPVTAPASAVEMWMNVRTSQVSYYDFSLNDIEYADLINIDTDVKSNTTDLKEIKANISHVVVLPLDPTEVVDNNLVKKATPGTAPALESTTHMYVRKYEVTGNGRYTFSAKYEKLFTTYVLTWVDANGNVVLQEYKGSSTEAKQWTDVAVIAPQDAVQLWMNVLRRTEAQFDFKEVTEEYVDVKELEEDVQQNTTDIQAIQQLVSADGKLMKVVIAVMEGNAEDMPFYIRTKYNGDKDIILTHRINGNKLLTFLAAYIGPKSSTDEELMTSEYLVSQHSDSTAALFDTSAYWALFEQHGYNIPYIGNTTGMTASDVDSEWVDQLNRHFIIGKVTDSYIYLLPVIYKDANNHDTRDWASTTVSADITSLTHISGGSHTETITVATTKQTQLRPIMEHSNRKWIADGVEITEAGTYYCDTFSVSESKVGYDPATINDWFGNDGGPVLTGALPMCLFTFSFNYCGAQCCLNTTINIKRETNFVLWGAIQQQFFVDKGDYKAMIMIPKAADRDGVVIEKPYSPTKGYVFYRNATSLKDVDNPIDRQIGFLYNPTTDEYLVGMAAGLSLVSGDTITSKRIQNCAIGNTDKHRVGSTSYSSTGSSGLTNKFYVAAINSSNYAENDYYYPLNYFKEVNAYVSYFDPAENVGQVYWYKDGSRYIIYAHCQTVQSNVAINVPPFMEGLRLSIVEKTNDVELLTRTIQNGKFFVNYNSDNANYIVLVTL